MKPCPLLLIAVAVSALTSAICMADYNAGLKAYDAKNYGQAMKEFKADGSKNSNYNLGVMYYKGQGVKVDHRQGLEYFKKAADQGHVNAQFVLGNLYDKGEDVLQDRAVAAKWYRKAAEQGHAQAQFNLGLMYTNGEGVEKDRQEAVVWLKKSARQGHKGAGKLLAVMGEEVPKAASPKASKAPPKAKGGQGAPLPPGHPSVP